MTQTRAAISRYSGWANSTNVGFQSMVNDEIILKWTDGTLDTELFYLEIFSEDKDWQRVAFNYGAWPRTNLASAQSEREPIYKAINSNTLSVTQITSCNGSSECITLLNSKSRKLNFHIDHFHLRAK